MNSDRDINRALQQRIIDTADEYHYIAEDHWSQAVDLKPEGEEDEFEFRRIARVALQFYARAYLVLQMVETDPEQQVEDLLEIIAESEPDTAEFIGKNDVMAVVDEEGNSNLSHLFAIAEAVRSMLLERSNVLAATLGTRFAGSSQ